MKSIALIVSALGLVAGLHASAQQVDFATPTTFSNSNILIKGPVVYAVSIGNNSAVTNVGARNLTFQAGGLNTNPNVHLTPHAGTFASYTGYLQSGTSGNAGLDTVLNTGGYNGTVLAGTDVTLNNLKAGRKYKVQLLVDDTRAGGTPNTVTATSGSTSTTPTQYAFPGSTTTLGVSLVGTVTATGTSLTFSEDVYLSGNMAFDDFQINGVVVTVASYNVDKTFGLDANQYAIATNLDNASLDTPIGAVIAKFADGSPQSIASALDQLSPEQFGYFTSVTAFNNASFETQAMDTYLAGQRVGPKGTFASGNGSIDASGLTINDPSYDPNLAMVHSRMLAWSPGGLPGALSDTPTLVLGGTDMKDIKDMKGMVAQDYSNPWNTFVRGNVILAQGFSQQDVAHFDNNTESVVIGTDYRFTPNFLMGITASYGHTDVTLDTFGSSATIDSYSPGFYASYADNGWYGNLTGNYTHNAYTQDRRIAFLGQTASSAPEGNQGTANLTGGYDFHCGKFTYGPLAGVQYTHLTVDGYQENGSFANLTVAEQQADSLRSRLGGHLSYDFNCGGTTVTPHLDASWQHEFLDQARGINSQFTNGGNGSFAVRTPDPSRDSALIDAGVTADLNRTVSVFTDYMVQAGQDNYFGQSVQAGVKIGF